ncbi:MAG TPA: hypothetical protein VGN44_06805 [Candidatus Angelobacter sp.]|jgi:hypothetical protein
MPAILAIPVNPSYPVFIHGKVLISAALVFISASVQISGESLFFQSPILAITAILAIPQGLTAFPLRI